MKRLGLPTAFMFSLALLGACDSGNQADTNPPGDGCPEQGARKTADDDCNSCTCTVDGWACTEMACVPPEVEEEIPTETATETATEGGIEGAGGVAAETCTAGETKDQDCNSCVCEDSGVWTCTAMACAEPDSPQL